MNELRRARDILVRGGTWEELTEACTSIPDLPYVCLACQSTGHVIRDCPSCAITCFICQSTKHVAKDCELNRKSKRKKRANSTPANGAAVVPTDSITESAKQPIQNADHRALKPKLRTKHVPISAPPSRQDPSSHPDPSSRPDSFSEARAVKQSLNTTTGISRRSRCKDMKSVNQMDDPTTTTPAIKPRQLNRSNTIISDLSVEKATTVTILSRFAGDQPIKTPSIRRITMPEAGNSDFITQKMATGSKSHLAPPLHQTGTVASGGSDPKYSNFQPNTLNGKVGTNEDTRELQTKNKRKRSKKQSHTAIDAIAVGRGIEISGGASHISEKVKQKPCGDEIVKSEHSSPRLANADEKRPEKRRERRRLQRRRDTTSLDTALGCLRISAEGEDSVRRGASSSLPAEI